jgi:hypothetical protein
MKIDYSDKTWCLKLPDTEEEWYTLVSICKDIGISFLAEGYESRWNYLMPSGAHGKELSRNCGPDDRVTEVSFYEMVAILTNTKKSRQSLQIEQLEHTIAQAMVEVNALRTGIKL